MEDVLPLIGSAVSDQTRPTDYIPWSYKVAVIKPIANYQLIMMF